MVEHGDELAHLSSIKEMKCIPARLRRYLGVELARVHLVRGTRRVLRGLEWSIAPGQRWVLLGDNGAGKTQLLKLIAGNVWPQPREGTRRRYLWRGAASDEPGGVKDEIAYLGAERQDRYEHYDWNFRASTVVGTGLQRTDTPPGPLDAAQRARVQRLLRRLGIESLAGRRFLALSQGERRLVLLARALAWRPALLLLDEPLNGLDAPHRAVVMTAIESLARSGLPWVYATQHGTEAPPSATHWARLHAGRVQRLRGARPAGARARRATRGPAVSPRAPHASSRAAPRPVEFELRNATVWRGARVALRRVSLRIRSGERWLVHGPNGSGKSTLLGTLYGDHAVAATGSIRRRRQAAGTTLADFQRRAGCVGPDLQAALPRRATASDCVVAALRGGHVLTAVPSARERRVARGTLARVSATRYGQRKLGELSYGQARRVLFARALALDPDILLLDEPYTGLDERTRARLQRLVEAAARRGCTIVIATHRRGDGPWQATHELELASGRIVYCGPLRTASRARARSRA
jgi:molybdate transport system ATP-binding protein